MPPDDVVTRLPFLTLLPERFALRVSNPILVEFLPKLGRFEDEGEFGDFSAPLGADFALVGVWGTGCFRAGLVRTGFSRTSFFRTGLGRR